MEFRVLGVLEALDAGLPVSLGGPKQRSVLAMLLLDANRSVSTDRLVDGLWGDEPPQRAAATLQVYVSNLRKALEPDRSPRAEPTVLLTQAPGYVLAVDPEQVDLFRFERLVGVARSLASQGSVAGAAVLFREALALWREAPLADLANEPFARFEVPRLEEARIGAIEDRIDAELALGRDVDVAELEGLVGRYPYRERFRRHLMVALYPIRSAGRRVGGLPGCTPRPRRGARHRARPRAPARSKPRSWCKIPSWCRTSPPLVAEDVALVLQAVNGVDPDPCVVDLIVAEACVAPRRAEEALRRAIEREQSGRLSSTVAAAGVTQVELARARRVVADTVLDRRRRREPIAAIGGCPYKGLLRFEPEDAGWYFGRERLVADLLATVASAALYGCGRCFRQRQVVARARGSPCGPGATTPLPGSAEWPRVLVTPGADPMLELARVLAPICHAPSTDHVRYQLLDDPESFAGFAARAMNGTTGDGR